MFSFPVPPAAPGSPMKIEGVARLENALTFLSSSGDGFRVKVGDVVQADVLSVLADGTVSIRITLESGKSGVVSARSHVPLDAGESVLLKVTGGEREVSLRFLGVIREEGVGKGGAPGLTVPYRGLPPERTAARIPASDARRMEQMFRSFPDAVKEAVPGFSSLERSPSVESLDGKVLKTAVEGSGVLLETKLKAAGAAPDGDRKEALLRVGEALRRPGVAAAVKAAGASPGEAAVKADGMLSTIETYQVSSSVHGFLFAPLSLEWDELADGEILFRKKARGRGESYTCELHLDLLPLGKMGVSVTMYDGAFYVSFSPEAEETRSLVASRSEEVGKRFREAGLSLSAVSIQRKKSVSFGVPSADGVDLEV